MGVPRFIPNHCHQQPLNSGPAYEHCHLQRQSVTSSATEKDGALNLPAVSGGDSTFTVTIPEARPFRFKAYFCQLLESSETLTHEGPLRSRTTEGSQNIFSSTVPSSVTQCTVDQDGSLKLLAVRVLDNPLTPKIASAQSHQRHSSALSPSLNQGRR